MNWNYAPRNFTHYSVGDIVTWSDGKRYCITKKTSTAMAMERYYWFDALADWLRVKLGI